MKSLALALGIFLGAAAAAAAAKNNGSFWERALVSVEVTRLQYDYAQPWSKRMGTAQKFGVVIGPRQILTTADYLYDRTLIRLQKGGRGQWWTGEVEWLDYHANLALLTTTNTAFWEGLSAAALADPVPTQGSVQLVRWRNGILELRKADINRLRVKRGKLSFVDHVQMELDTEASGLGWAEVVVSDRKLFGVTSWQEGNSCTALPSPFIRSILDARKKGDYRGLGYFDFTWQPAENPATLKFLGLEGEPRGVIVIDVSPIRGKPVALEPKDILLEIDGFAIDIQGDYRDPVYGNLSLENLAARHKWAGDQVPMKIWRDGRLLTVRYPLPKAEFGDQLVPDAHFDQEPEYLIIGGLVFQPLTEPFLRIWGTDWRRRAPFRLAYNTNDRPSPDRPALVVLSIILPDPFNVGYQDTRYLTVNSVNGRKIHRLPDLAAALEQPDNGFHVIEFAQGETLRRIVLEAAPAAGATQRILERYGINKDRVLAPGASGRPAVAASSPVN